MHDTAWFDEVFTDYAVAVHRFIRRRIQMTTAAIDADDITADVFTVVWRRRADVPDDAVLPWLYGVARHLLANHYRKMNAQVRLLDADVDAATDPAELVAANDELSRAWLQLGARDRQILALIAWEGQTEAGVAEVLGLSVGGASSAITRARQRFSSLLQA
ncbi:MAG: sigma-70 family RNA polymerase sigma factor [Candidatus Nanopelagicales bacterium]|jgi:RNA polymerase sigma factor (sigma-70 family)|nr:sigma-70 family RNA polymerase sigma factor [Candidatus Nanopelagicales bacterium]MDP4887650.1 sigma-70 family RNA polymerase sigma factor [Candidatus Nanopelagicales bacterium]